MNEIVSEDKTFIETVLKIIGPQIVAEFIERTWNSFSDEKRQKVITVVDEQIINSLSNNNSEVRRIAESKMKEAASKAAEELAVIYYPKILERANEVYKRTIQSSVEAACRNAVNKALEVVKTRLDRELENIIWENR